MVTLLERSCHLKSMESRGEYVKFSKEMCQLDSPSDKLKRELEEELKQSTDSLLSHGWYHGRIPWEVSETQVLVDGDFLVRDSLTSAGDYVLTSCWHQRALHFLISKTAAAPSSGTSSQVRYSLEGESFDSVPALVHDLVGSQRPITQQSGARIYAPLNRTLPLRYLEAMFALASPKGSPGSSPTKQVGVPKRRQSITLMDGLTIEIISPYREAVKSCAGSWEPQTGLSGPSSNFNSMYRRKTPSRNRGFVVVPTSPALRRPSEPRLSGSPDQSAVYLAPTSTGFPTSPNPSPRASTQHSTSPHLQPSTDLTPGHGENDSSLDREQNEDKLEEDGDDFIAPVVEETSSFQPSEYHSQLLPAENKPLETNLLRRVKEVLTQGDARTVAMHITKVDCMVARIVDVSDEVVRRMGVSCGLELLTLPHGHQLRQDLLDRFHTMAVMLAVELLGCTGSAEERATLLHKAIQLAQELKSSLGNMFGFAMVMRALELPQISRLDQSWAALRQHHTESAVLYEKTLKPFLRSMNEGKEVCVPSNTAFPHILPLLSLLERTTAAEDRIESWESLEAGVDSVFRHLVAARTIACHGKIFCATAETKLQGFSEKPDVLEVFLTEFQMRLLWGSRGALENRDERYYKFDKVLTALSKRLEPT